jgi:N-acetylmuramoyl-L-alanine amidase
MNSIPRGQYGAAVNDVQRRLHELGYDRPGFTEEAARRFYGEATQALVRVFQEERGLRTNGEVDDAAWQELVEAGWRLGDRFLYLRVPLFRGDDVREVQRYLNSLGFHAGREDGIFGQDTDRAVRTFQENMGLPADGIVGASTIEYLQRLRHAVKPTSVAEVKERILDAVSLPLEGRVVMLDAGSPEACGCELLISLSGGLAQEGARPLLVEEAPLLPDERDRASFANLKEAEVVLSICPVAGSQPLRAFFFAGHTYTSPRGQRLAQLMVGALKPLGYHGATAVGRSFPLLRETRMTCVVLELPDRGISLPSVVDAMLEALRDYFA